jgi:hypothetical protein
MHEAKSAAHVKPTQIRGVHSILFLERCGLGEHLHQPEKQLTNARWKILGQGGSGRILDVGSTRCCECTALTSIHSRTTTLTTFHSVRNFQL